MDVSGQDHAPAALLPRKMLQVPTGQWASEPVWTLLSREKSLASAGNRTPAVQPVASR
jgi:hypothetical protein